MKIIVYAITKNEEKFVKRWINSMKEADEIYVLDTGSTDNTVSLLKKYGVKVKSKKIKPWRFDVARNESLKEIPLDTDICVCTDLDEVFEKGWRKELEKRWNKSINRISYNYIWSFDKYEKPLVNFYIEKIHSRNDFIWTHPVHEVLTYIGKDKENKIIIDNITLKHFPDKNKSRSSYLPLLKMSIKENPDDDRNMHYLGREYMYYGKWNKCISTLIKHLRMPSSTWKEERCASMRFIARSYSKLGRMEEAKMWLLKAIKECPNIREGYTEYAILLFESNELKKSIYYFNKALRQKEKNKIYINEPFCYDGTIYDYLSVCHYSIGNLKASLKYVKIAIKYDPDEERLKENLKLIKKTLKKVNTC